MKQLNSLLIISFVASITLGLAPYSPEPHVWEKLRWLFQGSGPGWNAMYIFDFFLHGTPWLVFITVGLIKLFRMFKPTPQAS